MSKERKTLWTSTVGSSAIARMEIPVDLSELIFKLSRDASFHSEARVKAYRTPVTADTLRILVK